MKVQFTPHYFNALCPWAKSGVLACSLLGGSLEAQVTITPLTLSGDNAPGTTGGQFAEFERPSINEGGDVAFLGMLTLGVGDVPGDGSGINHLGIWKQSSAGGTVGIVRSGDLTSPFVNFSLHEDYFHHGVGFPRINKDGQVSFSAGVRAPNNAFFPSLWISAESGGNWQMARRNIRTPIRYNDEGNQVAEDLADDPNRLSYEELSEAIFSSTGEAFFLGTVEHPDSVYHGRSGAWFYPVRDGAWEIPERLVSPIYLVLEGDPAPGVAGAEFAEISMLKANGSQAMFAATLRSSVPDSGVITDDNQDSLWVFNNYASVNPIQDLQLIAGVGNAAPGTSDLFYRLGSPCLNNEGQVVFWASLLSSVSRETAPGSEQGIWTYSQGNGTQAIALEGMSAPGVSEASFSSFGDPVIDEDGEVAFVATISGDGIDANSEKGIWHKSPGGALSLVALAGSQAPGCPAGASFTSFNTPQFNKLGQMMFTAFLALENDVVSLGSNVGCWVRNGDGSISKVLRTGDALQVGPGDSRTVAGMSVSNLGDGGELALSLTFIDDTSGVFLVTLPDDLAPTTPGNVAASWTGPHSVDLSWSASTDDLGVEGYQIFRDGMLLTTVGAETLSLQDTGLTDGTRYTYTIQAFDFRNNQSALSIPASVYTPAIGAEVIIDNEDPEFTSTGDNVNNGIWRDSSGSFFYGPGDPEDPMDPRDPNRGSVYANKVDATATWSPDLPSEGMYQVYAWWTNTRLDDTTIDRDSAADYIITHADGATTVKVDQDVNGGQWNLLGTYTFNSGTSGDVQLMQDNEALSYAPNNGITISADAVRWVLIEPVVPSARLDTISPASAIQGKTFDLVIDAVDAQFNVGVSGVRLVKGAESLNAQSITVGHDNQLTAQFFISGSAEVGTWDVEVTTLEDGQLLLEDAFTVGDATGDANQNDVSDLLDYAFGAEGDDHETSRSKLPTSQIITEPSQDSYLYLTYRQFKDGTGTIGVDYTIRGLTYTVEVSSDLKVANWMTGAAVAEYVPGSMVDHGDGTVSVTVKVLPKIASADKMFARVKVSVAD